MSEDNGILGLNLVKQVSFCRLEGLIALSYNMIRQQENQQPAVEYRKRLRSLK
jgi:hypothetical protein